MAVVRFGARPTLGLRPSQLRNPRGPSGRPAAPTGLEVTGASGGTVGTLTPTLTFTAAPGATSHKVQWSTDPTFATVTGETTIAMPTAEYTHTVDLLNLTDYYWRLAAINAAGQGPWSDTVTVLTRVTLIDEHFAIDFGVLTEIDTNSRLAVSGGVVDIAVHGDNVLNNGLFVYSAGVSRIAGRALLMKHFSTNGNRVQGFGFSNSSTVFGWPSGNGTPFTFGWRGTKSIDVAYTEIALATEADNTAYRFAIVLMDTGNILLIKGGQYTTWTAVWYEIYGTGATLYPAAFAFANSVAGAYFDDFVLIDLPSTFPSSFSSFTLSVASPSAIEYVGAADQILNLTLTAPGTITAEAGIIFRKTDANNYWRAFFDTAGAFKVEKVVSGSVASTPINVAGIIAAGQTRTIQIHMIGNTIIAATYDGTKSLKRGSTISDSHAATATTVQPVLGTGWSNANLRSLKTNDAIYAMLDDAIGA